MRDRHPGALAMGVFFLAVGAAFLAEALGAWDLGAGEIWPVLLIGLGVAVLFSGIGRTPRPPQ